MRRLSCLLALLISACAAPAQQLPPDYLPGAVYGLDSESCTRMGGQETRDGNGLTICVMGTAIAVYACEGEGFVSLIQTASGATLLKTGDGSFGPVEPRPAASGELLGGEHAALHMKGADVGDGAVLIRPTGNTSCRKVR